MKRKPTKTIRDLEIALDMHLINIDLLKKRIEIVENSHMRLQAGLIGYIERTEKISEEKAKKLFDDLSDLQGKIVALKPKREG